TMDVLYGTNFHHGLMLAQTRRPQRIVLIAYSAPTAHWVEARQGELFTYPPSDETLALTRVELERAMDSGARIDAVLIDDPTRADQYSWTGRLREIHDLAGYATSRTHGHFAHIDTPANNTAIADIANAITRSTER